MNTNSIKLKVTEIQRFCMHDGPGIRTTVFLKGCPLRCEWCHNPETRKKDSELLFYPNKCIKCGGCESICRFSAHKIENDHIIDRNKCISCFDCVGSCPTGALERCGKNMTIDEILDIVERDKAFFGSNGGITLSGGEPLLNEEVITLLSESKKRGLTTAVETCGSVSREILHGCIPYVDLFLWDVKDTDEARHKVHTGVSNKPILENLSIADYLGAKTRLRCILVSGINTDKTHYHEVAALALGLKNCEGVEILPYHAYGGTKSVFCGSPDSGRIEWIPEDNELEEARIILQEHGIKVF